MKFIEKVIVGCVIIFLILLLMLVTFSIIYENKKDCLVAGFNSKYTTEQMHEVCGSIK